MPKLHVEQVAPGVHAAVTDMVSWLVLVEDGEVALVDCGYPAHLDAVDESVRRAGARPEQVRSVLVTHAHVDHVGSLPALVRRQRVRVRAGAAEVPMLLGQRRESATPWDVVSRSWRPRVAAWAIELARLGGSQHPHVETVDAVAPGQPLDLPARPVPVAVPGHTSGHTVYAFPDHGLVALGDCLVSAHRLLSSDGPQRLPRFFDHDPDDAGRSLADLPRQVAADILVPGHGPVMRQSLGSAVQLACS